MALLDRIANYFKEWDGIDETAPKMELSIGELRYIADMNIERCRLIRQLNEANIKTQELRANVIDEFAERIKDWMFENDGLSEKDIQEIDEIASQMKGEK